MADKAQYSKVGQGAWLTQVRLVRMGEYL